MRILTYLSPSALETWLKDPNEYYIRYLAEAHPERPPQSEPMSVGAAFDAYIKSKLYYHINGKYDDFSFEKLFEKQVEPQNRDFAREAGLVCLNAYEQSGILSSLLLIMADTLSEPKFETEVQGLISGEAGSVPLLGKPDMSFTRKYEVDKIVRIVLDWKVNGYCGTRNISPKKGYIMCLDGWDHSKAKPSRSHSSMHKDCMPIGFGGVPINGACPFEDNTPDWANQLSTYGWLTGVKVGEPFISIVHQLACDGRVAPPLVRIADHRGKISYDYQVELFKKYVKCWSIVTNESAIGGLVDAPRLEKIAKQYAGDENKMFSEMTRTL